MTSPLQRSLQSLREQGYRCAIVEHWNPHARCRQDMFNVLDIVALRNHETLGVQTTSASNVSARIKKINDAEALGDLRRAGWRLEVHGWRKVKNRWTCRIVVIS
jgi:hypothetical protein